MNWELLVQTPWLNRLGATLLHSLWQASALWLMLGMALQALRQSPSRLRHRLTLLALVLSLLLPVGTMVWLSRGEGSPIRKPHAAAQVVTHNSGRPPVVEPPAAHTVPASSPGPTLPIPPRPLPESLPPPSSPWLGMLAILWAACVATLTLRLAAGWWVMRRIQRDATRCTASWLPALLDRVALPAARILCSARIQTPFVAGWMRPVIYLPATLFGRMSQAAAETVLLHELAHLRRCDPLVNLGITTVETLLFFNPPVRAMANTARDEAESACDDQVLEWGGDRPTYARALAALETARPNALVLAATGGAGPLQRIQRILGRPAGAVNPVVSHTLGMAIVASITGFMLVCVVAVPPLARAFTPEERIAALAAVEATLPSDEKWEWEAYGKLSDEEGRLPEIGQPFHLCAWSVGYSAHSSQNSAARFAATGHGQAMRAGLWLDGYAPASVLVPAPKDAATHPEFTIPLKRGYPAILKVVDESGNPIANAHVRVEVVFAYNEQMYRQVPLLTSTAGEAPLGHADTDSVFRIEVRAHGHEWTWFEKTTFSRDHATTVTLKTAAPVTLSLVDDRTGSPIAGATAFCASWSAGDRSLSYGSRSMLASMAREPSGSDGRLTLDICSPNYAYDILLEAPGYGIGIVKVATSRPPQKVPLSRELRLGGVIHDPSRLFSRNTKEPTVGYSLDSNSGGSWNLVNFNIQFDSVARRAGTDVHFSIGQLNAGQIELRDGSGRDWKTNLTESKEDLVLYMSKAGLTTEDPAKTPVQATPQREVRFVLRAPAGQPPAQGNLQVRVKGKEQALPASGGIASGTFPVGELVSLRRYGLAGYTWAEARHEIRVEPGPGVQEVYIDLIAAGGLTGNIVAAPAKTRFMKLSGLLLRRSADSNEVRPFDGQVWITDNEQSYTVTSLPLDGEYRVILRSGPALSESPWLKIDSSNPLPKGPVTLPAGANIEGKVVEPGGAPASQIRMSLVYELGAWRYQFQSFSTAADGTFSVNGINFDVEGAYSLIAHRADGSAESTTPLSKRVRSVIITRPSGE